MADQKRTPKRSGYVQHVTPNKKNKWGTTYFDLHLQTEEPSPTSIKVYGDENYKRALDFQNSKSPVKMHTEWNETFQTYQVSERYSIEQASSVEVPYF